MSRYFLTIIVIFASLVADIRADTLAQWNFNSPVPDADATTGIITPSSGSGTASLVGLTTSKFLTGDKTNDPGDNADNSAWSPTPWPSATGANKSFGVQFLVDTTGYTNIMVSWSHENSATASKYFRLQYTTDGTTWTDFSTTTTVTASGNYIPLSVDLSTIGATANNNKFGFRIVSEWQSTAIGTTTNSYVQTTGTNAYSTSGTVRFDIMTVSGTVIAGGNTPPTIAGIGAQYTHISTPSAPISITVNDTETPGTLNLSAVSSDTTLIPNGSFNFTGTGNNSRTVTITPAPGLTGSATITVTVTDGGGATNSTSFPFTVYPANTPPTISGIPPGTTVSGGSTTALPFTIGDLETPGSLTVSGSSANPTLVPNANIAFGGSGTNRTVTVASVSGQSGVVPITVTVNDGTNTATSTFPVMVVPTASTLLYDPFTYDDGSLITNSAFLWANNSGTVGALPVATGSISLSSSRTEDVIAPLINAPISGSNLYSSFTVNFSTAPTASGSYFAHFTSAANTFRCRVFAMATNGAFRLGIASNASTTTNVFPLDLVTGTNYTVVTLYNSVGGGGSSTLWINPVLETDTNVVSSDGGSILAISSYSFREDTGIGTMTVDDVRVGLSFADVVVPSTSPPPMVSLSASISGGTFQVAWTTNNTAAATLQSNTNLATTNWNTVGQTPAVSGTNYVVTIPNPPGKSFYRLKF